MLVFTTRGIDPQLAQNTSTFDYIDRMEGSVNRAEAARLTKQGPTR
jgi:hypothetical protein